MGRKKVEEQAPPKPWGITQADLDATTDLEVAFATTRCLPPEDIIPERFRGPYKGDYTANAYLRLIDALFCGEPPPDAAFTFNEGFNGNKLFEFTMAHLRSFEPSHEHKISGLAYMISQIITIDETH